MKKRVRIYKPTNKFQDGGQQSGQFTPDQLISIYMTALAEPGSSVEEAEDVLRQVGIDENTITEISSSAQEYMDNEQYMNDSVSTADEDALTDLTADQAAEDAAYQQEQNALAIAEQEARSDAMQQMYADYSQPDYGDDTMMEQELIQRYGGMPSKRSFVKNMMKQVKKQMGGDNQQSSTDSTDPDNKRKEQLNQFISTIQENATKKAMVDDITTLYKTLTTPIGQDQSYYQEEQDMDYAQFGGMRRGQARRMNRRMNRMVVQLPIGIAGMPGGFMLPTAYDYADMAGMFGMPQMPAQGSFYGGPRLANIDVRRTGLFGRPKEYSINFADDVMTNPQLRQEVIKQEVKNKEQQVKDQVDAAKEGVVDQGVEEQKQVEEQPVDVADIQVVTSKGKPTSTRVSTDNWGRAKGNKWYGFDPKTKKWTLGKPSWVTEAPAKAAEEVKTYTPKKELQEVKVTAKAKPKPSLSAQTFPASATDRAANVGSGSTLYIPRERMYDYPRQDSYFDFSPEGIERRKRMTEIASSRSRQFQEGGMTNQASGLYMFLYGGNDPAIESPEGKLTNDPYFAEGGLTKYQDKGEVTEDSKNNTKNTFGTDQMPDWFKEWASQNASSGYRDPYSGWDGRGSMPYITTSNAPQDWRRANPQYYPQYPVMGGYGMPSIRTKQKGMPYMSGTRQPYMGSLDNARIKSIDVKKTRAFGPYKGMPKKYTVNYQVESDPLSKRLNFTDSGLTLDGRPVGDSSQRGMSPAGKKLTDRMIDSGVRPISWLGSRLQPFGITPDKSSGIPRDKNDEAYKRIYGHYPGEGTQLDLSKELAFQAPPISEDEQYPAIPDLAQMQGYQLPTRKPMPLSSMTGTPEIIPTKYGSPQGANFGPEVPPLEEGEAGPMGEEQALEEQEAAQAQRSYGLDLLDPIASMEDYMAQSADEDQLAEQEFLLQRMAMQNPDYFNQSPYNNPVFNPEEMTTGNIIDFNAPIVTPQQYVESQQRVPTYKSFKRSKASTIPATKDTRETRVAKATQEGNVPQVSRSSRVTTPFKTTEQKQKEYQDWANSRKTEQDKFYTNIAGEEKTAMKEKELREAQQNLKQESKSFKEKFGIDSATFNLYKTLLDNPTANKAVIDNMKKTYP